MAKDPTYVALNHDVLLEVLQRQTSTSMIDHPVVDRAVRVCHTLILSTDLQKGYERAIPNGLGILVGPFQRFGQMLTGLGYGHKFKIDRKSRWKEGPVRGLKAKHKEIVLGALAVRATYLISNWSPPEKLALGIRERGLIVLSPEDYLRVVGE